jgi:very-short-patch-repair endonuclease
MAKHSRPQTNLARKLRKKSTKAEQAAWKILRNRQIDGLKFYRQYPVGSYIVDFCCRTLDLVIEVDGDIHAGKETEDKKREEYLEKEGYRIIRFTNDQILYDGNQVVEAIRSVVASLRR